MNGKALLCGSLVLALGACASTFEDMTAGFNTLNGRPLQDAYAVFGYPDRVRDVDNLKYSEWSVNSSNTFMMPTTNYGNGYVGNTPYTYSYNSYMPMQVSYNCYVRIVSDQSGVIINGFSEGNRNGCEIYAQRMRDAGVVRKD